MDFKKIIETNTDAVSACNEYLKLEQKLEDFPVYADDVAGEKQRTYLEGKIQETFFALKGVTGLDDAQAVELVNFYSEQ